MSIQNILYTAHATAHGGRDGTVNSDEGTLSMRLAIPIALGGAGGSGTNPEQLFAAGYSACFLSTLKHVASERKISLPADAQVTASVGVGPIPEGFGLAVTLSVHLPAIARTAAQEIIEHAHRACPYSNATRNNVDVRIELV